MTSILPPQGDDYFARRDQFTADTDLQDLLARVQAATPAQVKTYVNTNVTDLASAKILLAKIILLLAIK